MREVLDGLDQLRKHAVSRQPSQEGSRPSVERVLAALDSFTDVVRYLNTRRSQGAILVLDDEAAVQDVLYLMLRPWIEDLVAEDPNGKVANTFAIKDFVSVSSKIVIEAKFVRDKGHGKAIVKEINDDIETYRYHAACDDLIFFIYDPESHIPDAAALERHVRGGRAYGGKVLRCHAVIKP
jgi:hypothetical protein